MTGEISVQLTTFCMRGRKLRVTVMYVLAARSFTDERQNCDSTTNMHLYSIVYIHGVVLTMGHMNKLRRSEKCCVLSGGSVGEGDGCWS